MNWFFFALTTPFLFTLSNFVDKFLVTKKLPSPVLLTIMVGLISGALGLIIEIFIGFPLITGFQAMILIFAGIFLATYLVPYFKAINMDDTSRVVPLFQFVPIFTIILSVLFLHETISSRPFLGFILVMVGGFVLGSDKFDITFLRPRPSFWLMVLSSLLYACANILFRFSVQTNNFWPSLSLEFIGMGIGAIIIFLFIPKKRQLLSEIKDFKGILKLISLAEFFALIARISNNFALSLAPAAFVTIVRNSQPLFLLIIGLFLSLYFPKIIKEDISRKTIAKKLINVTLILFGLALVYF